MSMTNLLRARTLQSTLVLGSVCVLGVSALVAQSGVLRFQWNKGETLRYRATTESNVLMSGLPGGDMTVTNSLAQVQALMTESVAADGSATVRATTESVRLDIGTPMGTMSYDSTSKTPPTDPMVATMASMLSATIGHPIMVVFTPDGGVKSVTGGSAMIAKIKQKLTGADLESLGDLEAQMGDEALRAGFDQGLGSLPGKPVKTGDTWSTTIKVPNPMGNMTVNSTFTMQGTQTVDGRELTKIGIASKITGGAGEMGPMSTQLGNGNGDGEMFFDHKFGRIQRLVMRQTLPMTMSMAGPDGSPLTLGGQVRVTTTMALIEK
jgi:hypothetical protein